MRSSLMKWILLAAFVALSVASQAQQKIEEVKLSQKDVDAGLSASMKVQTGKIDLSAEQKKALAANPLIDSAVAPLTRVDFKVRNAKTGQGLEAPVILNDKAAVMIPYQLPAGVREADLDAFVWDDAHEKWVLAGCSMRTTADNYYEIASDTEVFPKLSAVRAQPTRLATMLVLKKRAGAGLSPEASGKMKKVHSPVSGIKVTGNKDFMSVMTDKLELVLSKRTGAIYRYAVLGPEPFAYTADTLDGLKIYLANKDRNIAGFFDDCRSIDLSKVNFQGEDYLVIDMAMVSTADRLDDIATVHLQYRIGPEMTFTRTDVSFLDKDPSQFELGMYQRYNPMDWQRQIFPAVSETLERPIGRRCFARYSNLEEDTTRSDEEQEKFLADNDPGSNVRSYLKSLRETDKTEFLRTTGMPWSIVEGERSFMMYGFMDIGTVMIASPNRFKSLPSFSLQPKGVPQGKTYTFDCFMKFFPKPENTITDVCEWYARHRFSSCPLDKDYTTMPPGRPHKGKLPRVNVAFERGENPARMRDVIPGWRSWDEEFLTTGTWLFPVDDAVSDVIEMNPDKLKAAFAEQRAKGRYIYPYTRQIRFWCAYHEDRPPYLDWRVRGKGGFPFSYNLGAAPEEEQMKDTGFISEAMRKRIGLKPDNLGATVNVHDDFCNPQFNDWYVKQHQDYQAFYDIDGYFFDMGWDVHIAPCWNHPEAGVHHGILRAMARITDHGRTLNPPKTYIANGSIHSPTMNFVDAIMINEGGLGANKLAIDSIKFNRPALITLIYSGSYDELYGKDKSGPEILKGAFKNVSCGGPHGNSHGYLEDQPKYKQLLDFSAYVTPMSLVYEDDSIFFTPRNPQLTGSVWVDEKDFCVAIFNDSPSDQPIQAWVDLKRLREYGHAGPIAPKFQIQDTSGALHDGSGFKVTQVGADLAKIEGVLPAQSLLMGQ